VSPPTSLDTAAVRARTPLERTAVRAGTGAALVLAWSAAAFVLRWPQLPTAMPVAASIGLAAGLLIGIQHRARLCAFWAELTACVAAVFWCANAWNFAVRGADVAGAIDLLLGGYLVGAGFALARRARRARDEG